MNAKALLKAEEIRTQLLRILERINRSETLSEDEQASVARLYGACEPVITQIVGIRMHDLRHSFASIFISRGVSPAYVQQQLGHSSIKMTVDTYTHLIPGADRQALQALPGITSPTLSAAAGEAGDDPQKSRV